MAIRVLQVVPDLSAGGAEGFVTNLGVSLTQLGADVQFFLLGGVRGERGAVLYSRLKDAGIEVAGADLRNLRSLRNVVYLRRTVHSWMPDIVQANMYQAELFTGAARLISAKRGTYFVRRLASTRQSFYRSAAADRIVRLGARLFDLTIACSPAASMAYKELMRNLPVGELVTIPNGGHLYNSVTGALDRRAARMSLGIHQKSFVVAHIGSMFGVGSRSDGGLEKASKAHDVLIAAFARAFARIDGCILAMIGDGPLRPALERFAAQLGVAEKVLFLGQQAEPWPLLIGADVFCFPSRQEGHPNALLEAASCGVPIVASDIATIRWLSSGTAWTLKPVDDVDAFAAGLLDARRDIDRVSQQAREDAPAVRDKFSMEACAQRYLDVYGKLLRRERIQEEDDHHHGIR